MVLSFFFTKEDLVLQNKKIELIMYVNRIEYALLSLGIQFVHWALSRQYSKPVIKPLTHLISKA